MKIKQIGNYTGDIVSTILENRKLDNVALFLNPNNQDDLDALKLSNMRQAAEIVLAHVISGSRIGLLVDPDADGFTSASIIYQYLKKLHPEIEIIYFLHDSKAHGLTEKMLEKISYESLDLIVIPDAASNDEKALQRLYAMGIDVVVIDHHEVEEEPKYGIIVNNQLPHNQETNKNLVGAGMSFKFCQAMDTMLKVKLSEDFYDLIAIGQVGDASDISQNEVRNLVFKGVHNITNPFVKVALTEHYGTLEGLAPKDLSFSIIPLINSVVRVGTMEEKDILFRALNSIRSDEMFEVTKKKKNKDTGKFDKFEITQNLYEYAYDQCKKVKARQAAMVKKIMATLNKEIDSTGGIAIGVMPVVENGSVTGLVASKFSHKLQKPVLLVHKVDKKYTGSGRGYEKTLPSLKDWCNDTGLVEFAQGHANAFGISVFEENFESFKKKAHEVTSNEFIYEVDLHLKGNVEKKIIMDILENRHIIGGKVHEPLLAFTGIKVRKDFIRQRGSMLTFFEAGIEFIMYSAPDGLFESLTNNFDRYITMDFVGRASSNTYGGRTTYQLVLDDCERNEIQPSEEKIELTAENIVF